MVKFVAVAYADRGIYDNSFIPENAVLPKDLWTEIDKGFRPVMVRLRNEDGHEFWAWVMRTVWRNHKPAILWCGSASPFIIAERES